MNRREFIRLIGGAAAVWPLAARAEQPAEAIRRVGLIGLRPENAGFGAGYRVMLDEFRKLGYGEDRNLIVEYRFVEQDSGAVFADAAELVRSKVDVLIAIGPEVALRAAVAATSTTPIVFAAINYDPIARGYVKGLAQPGGNVTGFFIRQTELAQKQVELLAQAFPDKTRLAILWDDFSADQLSAAEQTARLLHLDLSSLKLEHPPYDVEAAFRSLTQSAPQMLLVLSSPLFVPKRQQIVDLATRYRLPNMHIFKRYVEDGGLMSYGADGLSYYRRVAFYAAKILRGAKPTDLPVEQPTIYELVVNLKAAKAMGIELPTAILLRADEVLE